MTETLVCDRELAEKLKSLGYPQNTYFGWYAPIKGRERDFKDLPTVHAIGSGDEWSWHELICAAPTAGELEERLPMYSSVEKHSKEWRAGTVERDKTVEMGADNTLVNAMAKMWIFLREQGLIQF